MTKYDKLCKDFSVKNYKKNASIYVNHWLKIEPFLTPTPFAEGKGVGPRSKMGSSRNCARDNFKIKYLH